MSGVEPWSGESADDGASDGPVFGERRRRAMRIIVLLALVALLLPLVLSALGVARSAADRACAAYAADYQSGASSQVEFDLFAEGGPGWLCFASTSSGGRTLLGNLGPMPAAPRPVAPGRDA
jgi:hypothetical protein